MRLHTDELTFDHLYAAVPTGTALFCTPHGSRERDHAFEVKLYGYAPRHTRRAGDNSGARAATWSDWGRFFAALFAADPALTCYAYDGADAFHRATRGLFAPGAAVTPTVLADEVRRQQRDLGVGRNAATGFVAGDYGLPSYTVKYAIFGE